MYKTFLKYRNWGCLLSNCMISHPHPLWIQTFWQFYQLKTTKFNIYAMGLFLQCSSHHVHYTYHCMVQSHTHIMVDMSLHPDAICLLPSTRSRPSVWHHTTHFTHTTRWHYGGGVCACVWQEGEETRLISDAIMWSNLAIFSRAG